MKIKKQILIEIDKSVLTQFKIACLDMDRPMKQVIPEMIVFFLKGREKTAKK